MNSLLARFSGPPATIVEEIGPDHLIPAYPFQKREYLSSVQILLLARQDILWIWGASDYRSHLESRRILGRQVIVANTPESVKHVMATSHDNYDRKSPQMRRALENLLGDGLFISEGETWHRRRPLVSDIVHKNRLPVFAPVMERVAGDMADRWSRLDPERPVDALVEMAVLTSEIIARTVFGNNLGHENALEVIEGFTGYQRLIDSINIGYFVGFDEGLPVLRTPRLKREIRRVHRVIDKVVEDHLAGRGDHNSMIDLLIRRQQKNPEAGLDRDALRNEAATIFMAGHETTATTLAWAWYLLSNAPWAEKALLDEIATVCGDRAPAVEDVPRLDYARAVIEETLRLYPPVPILARQARKADRIAGIDVDPAALIMVVPWLLHRSTDLWDEASAFRPERFLSGRPTPYTYIPFAAGPRICAGLQFGLTESILCLAVLAQRFRVRVVPGTKVEPQCRLTLRPRSGLPVTIEGR